MDNDLILRSIAKQCVSKDEGPIVASWFETAQERLLTMRVQTDLCQRPTKRRPA